MTYMVRVSHQRPSLEIFEKNRQRRIVQVGSGWDARHGCRQHRIGLDLIRVGRQKHSVQDRDGGLAHQNWKMNRRH